MIATPPSRPGERGVATLGIVMLLLLAVAVMAAFQNRSLLFEQRASANQYRATRAFGLADAGLDWAQSLLNDPRPLDARCHPDAAADRSFRDRHVPLSAAGLPRPDAAARPGCRWGPDGPDCRCPAAGEALAVPADDPGFVVEFAAVDDDPRVLRLTARGCASGGPPCAPASSRPRADATAAASVLLRLRPAVAALPVAALTTGGSAALGRLQLVNLDLATHGLVVDAGDAVDAPDPGLLTTLPGSPPANALLAHDDALAAAAADDRDAAFFAAWFGADPTAFAAVSGVHRLTGCDAADCAPRLQQAVTAGRRALLVDGDLTLDAASWPGAALGGPDDPVLLATTGRLSLRGRLAVHGLVYADQVVFDGGALDLRGALVTRRSLVGSDGRIVFDPALLQRLRRQSGAWIRIAGSWRDGRCASDDLGAACRFAP